MRKLNLHRCREEQTNEPQQKPQIDNKKRLTLLAAIEQVVELAEKSNLSEEFFTNARRPIRYLRKQLSLTQMEAVLLSLFMDKSDDQCISLSNIASYLNCRNIRLLQYTEEVNSLEKRGYIRSRRHSNEQVTYRVPQAAIEAIKENRPFTPQSRKNLSCSELFGHIDELFEQRDNSELSTEQLTEEFKTLLEENRHLTFAQKTLALVLVDNDLLLFIRFCHLFVENDDDNIGFHDISDLYDSKIESRVAKRALAEGYSHLITTKLIENTYSNGFADRESFKLTEQTKQAFLGELHIRPQQADNQQALIQYTRLAAKQLYYNSAEQKQIDRLAELLQPENFRNVQQRLKECGMRQGFACLFHGAPGTGKTETVYQLARRTGRNIMQVNIAEIKSMWVGESEKNIKGLFDKYRTYVEHSEVAPILLFNEADAIIGIRQKGAEQAVEKMENSLQNIILQEMEELGGILIATTNLTQNMDKAFERRFLYKIAFEKPSTEAKASIWQAMIPAISNEEAHTLATQYDFTGGQIENIARKQTVETILTGQPTRLETLHEHCHHEQLVQEGKGRKIGFR